MDDVQLLSALDAVILKRLNGDAYVEYTSATMRFKGETLSSLMDMRRQLQEQINAQQRDTFTLGRFFRD